jgi:predicted metal-dependent phosphoesterase TrpH
MTDRLGRADLHLHTLASDGTAGVVEILERVEADGILDVIAITDHERIDAALAARAIARERGSRVEVVLEERIPAFRSLRWTIAAVHEQGGLAIPAHPLTPYPLCASGRTLRRLLHDPDRAVHPDGLETFNPTALGRPMHAQVGRFAAEFGLARVGSSDAHTIDAIGRCWTTFPGRSAEELRHAILGRTTHAHGEFHGPDQVATFGRQLRKYGRDARAGLRGALLRDGTGRDLGYPGGHRRPARYEPGLAARPAPAEELP